MKTNEDFVKELQYMHNRGQLALDLQNGLVFLNPEDSKQAYA